MIYNGTKMQKEEERNIMKKFFVALLSFIMIIGMTMPVSANVKPTELGSAADGSLIYSFNFNGDENYSPMGMRAFAQDYTATISEDGRSVTIKNKTGKTGEKYSLWGGLLEGYTFAKTDVHNKYAFVYKIKANNSDDANLIGVGGFSKIWNDDYKEVCGNSGKFTTGGTGKFGLFVNTLLIWKDKPSLGVTGYVSEMDLGEEFDVDSEGFMTMMVVYEGASDKYHSYALTKGGDVNDKDDWIYMQWANLGLQPTNYLGFVVYVHSAATDVTIKDARIYKGLGYGTDPADAPYLQTGSNTGSNTNQGTSSNVSQNTETEADTSTETEADTSTETEADTSTETEADTGTETNTDTETEVDTGKDTEKDKDSNADDKPSFLVPGIIIGVLVVAAIAAGVVVVLKKKKAE